MKHLKLSILLLFVTFITACSMIKINTSTTAFYTPEFTSTGSIAVIPADIENNNSLEFSHYKQKIEDKLRLAGYSIAANSDTAEYIAIVAYGIDDGETSLISTPIFSSPNALRGGRLAKSKHRYSMPRYHRRVIGTSTSSITTYNRALALDIVEASSLKNGPEDDAKKVYESRVKSVGECGVVAGVFNELLEAMFTNFPGESGQTINAKIPYDGQC
ncbi:hypothetical protein [uncultured Psychromonas sp.]|uniref:hypothetical protein n=1 Tax=uncultured Psychromonas sp. TaxID=173974 RepID=UPI00261C43C6|nr:hypothetical protein [uncultured Psychromonas sp.]